MFVGYRIDANAYGKLFVSDLCRNAEQCCDDEVFCDVYGIQSSTVLSTYDSNRHYSAKRLLWSSHSRSARFLNGSLQFPLFLLSSTRRAAHCAKGTNAHLRRN